jgi:hypothetical protein
MAFIPNTNTLVTLANGTKKVIEELMPGDLILDSDNFPCHVFGRFRFSQEDLKKPCIKINDEIIVTNDQAFLGADGYFYILDGINNEIFQKLNVCIQYCVSYNSFGLGEQLNGINESLIKPLVVGSVLMKDTGEKTVDTIEVIVDPYTPTPPTKNFRTDWYDLDPSTLDVDSFNINDFITLNDAAIKHRIARSGTYIVNGYKCLSVPNNQWDYVNWKYK